MNLDEFKKYAAGNKEALSSFLHKLDTTLPRGLGKMVAAEDTEVWQQIDCTACANCCKTMTPIFTKADIKRISTHLRITPKAFFDKWLEVEADTGSTVNRTLPCQFLVDNKCSIYEVRPRDCAEFPHHNKRPFDLYNDTFLQNIDRCPATNLLIEQLKSRIEQDFEWE